MKIIGIIGDRGSGKSALMTLLLNIDMNVHNRTIFSNYWLSFIDDDHYITFSEMAKMPDYLRNCSIGMDEVHMWADARKFFSDKNADLAKLVTQIRKLGINLYYTTQRFRYSDTRLRDQTDYIIFPEPIPPREVNGVWVENLFKFDIQDAKTGEIVVRSRVFDATTMFEEKWYDTNEIIDFENKKEVINDEK